MPLMLFHRVLDDYVLDDILSASNGSEIHQRLEFLGDCVLNLCITELLFFTFTTKNEGTLSKLRSILIGKAAFCFLIDNLSQKKLVPVIEEKSLKKKSDALETVFGILFLETGFEYTRKIFFQHCSSVLLAFLKNEDTIDYKSLLQSFSQRALQQLPLYTTISHRHFGKNHIFHVSLQLNGVTTEGKSDTLVQAQQKAAREMCLILKLDFFSEL